MEESVAEIVLVYLMMVYLTPLAASDIVTGVSLVGGSGPHEGTIQLNLSSDDGSQPPSVTRKVTLLHYRDAIATCRTLGYPGVNKVFRSSPYSADFSNEPGFHLRCNEDTTVIGCQAFKRPHFHRYAVRCQNANAIIPAMPAGPDHADTGDTGLKVGVGVIAVLLAVLAMVNVYVYARTRKMVSMTRQTTKARATTSTTSMTSNKHDVYQSLTTPPISDYYTRLDVPSRDQDDSYDTPISAGEAHSGVSVVAVEMEPVYEMYEVASPGSEEVMMTATPATSTASDKHDVFQPRTTPPTSDYDTRLDVPSRDQDDSYENLVPMGWAHSGVPVAAMEMEPVYEEASSGSEEVMTKTTNSSDCFYEPVYTDRESAV